MRCSHPLGRKNNRRRCSYFFHLSWLFFQKVFFVSLVEIDDGSKKQQEEVLLFLPSILAVLPKGIFCLFCWNWWWDDDKLL